MKRLIILFYSLFVILSINAQFRNGEYEVKGYTSEVEGENIRDGEFKYGTMKLLVHNDKFISLISNDYPFYAWIIDKMIKDNRGIAYHLKDVRNGNPQFVYYEYQEKDSKMFNRDCILLYIYWSKVWIDKLYLVREN